MTGLLDDDGLLDIKRKPAAATAHPAGAAANPTTASTSTLCPLCNIRPGRQRCNSCGKLVCPADIWTMLGLCKSCATAEDFAHWHRPAAPEEKNWLGGRT